MTGLAPIPGKDWLAASGAAARGTGAFNEAFDTDGQPRPHWQTLLQSLAALGKDEFAVRAENGRRILREHGVSHRRPQAGEATGQGWDLDFVPLVIAADEWRRLASGLAQRARLLNAILADLYSVQRLVRDGFVPAPLVYANPGFLRACQGLPVPGGTYLHVYAADLGRLPDGGWRVLADRTQAPTGQGFTQEARTVSARVLPEAIHDVRPRSLTMPGAFRRDTFALLAPPNRENPTVVVLTPGPGSQAYFEDAYVARLLGFTLVEGDDLSVRDRRVFIKTLDGLRPVDVILRRLNDSFCDPLELRSDSVLGVPGLVEAARSGRVAIANALGTGLLESPAFLPFLPALCRHLLDEELQLPSVPTWWCGQRPENNYVQSRAQELNIRPAFGFPAVTEPRNSAALAEQLRMRAHEWIGQEPFQLSQAPALIDGQWQSRPVVLRVIVVHNGGSYLALSGGLARWASESNPAFAPPSFGTVCKDVWVLQDEQAEPISIQHTPALLAPRIERSASDLPSRTADNLFWLGRYAERLEHLARIARCVINRLSDEAGPGSATRLSALARLAAGLGLAGAASAGTAPRRDLQEQVLALLYDNDRPGGMRDLLQRIRVGAFSLRHRLSADTSGIVTRLGAPAGERPGHLPLVHASGLLNGLIVDLAAFSGMQMENVTRGHGWVFLDLGRRLERVLNLAQLLEIVVRQAAELDLLFEPVLEIADSVMTYRWRYFGLARLDGILDLLLLEPLNPRSLVFQLARLQEHAAHLPAAVNPDGVQDARRRVASLVALLEGQEPGALSDPAHQAGTVELLARITTGARDLSELLTQVYFSHVQPRLAEDEIAAL